MDIIYSIIPATIAYTIPLLMGALGALYSERSGVTNLCIEGLMLMGCFTCGFTMAHLYGKMDINIVFAIGLISAIVFSAIFSLLHAVAAINLRADQVISGTAINMISTALTVFLAMTITGSGNITILHSVVPFSIATIINGTFENILFAAVIVFAISFFVKILFKKYKNRKLNIFFIQIIISLLVCSFVLNNMIILFVLAMIFTSVALYAPILYHKCKKTEKEIKIEVKDLIILYLSIILVFIFATLKLGTVFRTMVFTRVYWTTIVCLIIWFASYLLLYKTSFGLRLRACGEHPSAVTAAGISVYKMRYIGVIASGAIAGLGGAVYLITVGGEFNSSSGMNGLGFLAIAGLIFGQWKPFGILGSTFFFGFCYTVANMSRVVPALQVVPAGFLSAFPYVATIFVLIFTAKKNAAPLASGQPY